MKKLLNWMITMSDPVRRNVFTWTMLVGSMVLTAAIALLVLMLRYSWSEAVVVANAPALIEGFFQIAFGLLGLQGLITIVIAAVVLGGKLRGKAGPLELEADPDVD